MLSKSLSIAKLLLALSIAIFLTSVYFGNKWSVDAAGLGASVAKTQQSVKEMTNASNVLGDSLQPDEVHVALEQALSEVMLTVFNERVLHGVSVSLVSPSRLTAGSGMARLDTLAERVPGTNVRSVRVNLTGTYATYQGLLSYMQEMENLPVAIVRLKIQDQSFEMSLRVYGK